MKENELVKNRDLVASYCYEKDSDEVDEDKSYRLVEDFSLRGAKGTYETLVVGRRRDITAVTLQGTLRPKEGCSNAAPVTIEVPLSKWRLYRYRDQKCKGICVHSTNQLVYRLGNPSREYEPVIRDLMTCVGYAKKIQLFLIDVIGTDDMEADNVFGLDPLLEMMTDAGLDRTFIVEHGSELFELLRELQMDKNFPFMLELKAMKSPKAEKRPRGSRESSVSSAASSTKLKKGEANSKAKAAPAGRLETSAGSSSGPSAANGSTSSSPPVASAPASSSSSASSQQVKKCRPEPLYNDESSHHVSSASCPSNADSKVAAASEGQQDVDKGKGRRRTAGVIKTKAGGAKDEASPARAKGSSSGGENAPTGATTTPTVTTNSPLKVAPEKLSLSEALPRLMSSLHKLCLDLGKLFEPADKHSNDETKRASEAKPPSEASIRKVLKEIDNTFKAIDQENLQPMHYLLADTYGGDDFFHPFFDLYRILKRSHYSVSGTTRELVTKLRKHLISRYTEPVLRDVWYFTNSDKLSSDVRSIKDGEKAVWKEAKRKRLEIERAEERKQRAIDRQKRREEKARLREEQGVRRKEWEAAHLERKQQRLLAKASKGGSSSMDVVADDSSNNKRAAEGDAEGGARKRTAVEGGHLADADLQLLNSSATTSPRTSTSGASDSIDAPLMDTVENHPSRPSASGKRCGDDDLATMEHRAAKVLVDCNGQKVERERAPI